MKLPKDIPGKVLCFLVFTYGDTICQSGTVLKSGFFCEYRSTDDVKKKKQKTENKTTPDKKLRPKHNRCKTIGYLQQLVT